MIRFAKAVEVGDIAALYHVVWHETHSGFMPVEECTRRDLDFFVDRMTKLMPTTLVIEGDLAPVGFSSWQDHLLGQIFVLPNHRGTGVASDLMSETERQMAKAGVSEAELHCVVGNMRARRFYKREGWLCKGQITEHVMGSNGKIDVPFWCMTKTVGPS